MTPRMRPLVIAGIAFVASCTIGAPVAAQWAAPTAVSAVVPAEEAPSPTQSRRADLRPRAGIVAPIAFLFGVAGGVAGYYLAEERCSTVRYECWDHFATIPLGYTLGVALGGGIAGTAEKCRSGLLRSTGGAVLGLVGAGLVFAATQGFGGEALTVVALPAGPVIGATWLVGRCRTSELAGRSGVDG